MKDLAKLKAACDAVIADPKLQPITDPVTGRILETHCNMGAMRVAFAMGCSELQNLTADQQYAVMDENRSGKWFKIGGPMASALAQQGCLVFAAMTSKMLSTPEKPDAHGHIAACYPAPMVMSGKLGRAVPMVANVGVKDAEEGENFAFPTSCGEADYFAYED